MAKVLDDDWGAERPNQADIWVRLFDALDRNPAVEPAVPPTTISTCGPLTLPVGPPLVCDRN